MTQQEFQISIDRHANVIEDIRQSAHRLHEHVNQTYDKVHPYGFHLDMVADSVYKYGHEVCVSERDILPVFFGAYYHDSMEDARQTYNDVMRIAKQWMDDELALMSTEIVYALTNEKGRTRAERAGEKYYQGIRETAYAPFVKLSDRLANITYSFTHTNESNVHMKDVYRKELPHFLETIKVNSNDKRFCLPTSMITELRNVVEQNL